MNGALYLDKILTQFSSPLGLALILSLVGLILLLGRRRLAGAGLLLVALAGLGLCSLPVVADILLRSLEERYPEISVVELPSAEAVIVLGGGVDPRSKGRLYPDLQSAADRVWHAARIFHAGKAPLVILSGGIFPRRGTGASEAEAMQMFLIDLGVPAKAICLEQRSHNTHENAVFTAEMLRESGLTRVLLVTSALHIPRAMAAFRAVGVEAVPAATDFMVWEEPTHLLRWLPDVRSFSLSTAVLHEYLGLWVYQRRGWA
ncbi:MAG TPA: YdcF family protein [Desulfobulbaceae bacterium]|nr:MAG: hypothetical protein A2520_03065 [Deltaproteobacteria bacterium RIFOXYD12_FULL_53_23]HCC54230.1 YdcF family protein [Desulfobulbaceae bacterium]